jgi:anti-sigma factor RsiW
VTCAEIDRDLDPYLDRELDEASAAVVRAHLESCPRCGGRLAERQELGRLLRTAPYYQAPQRLRAAAAAAAERPRASRRIYAWAASLAIAASLGGAFALARYARTPAEARFEARAADEVVDAHVRSLMGEHLFDVKSTDQHTVKPWFLGRVDFSPPVRDLAGIGFPLVGGRLDYVAGHQAAALVYQRQKHTINVFVWPAGSGAPAPTAASIRGFHIHGWTTDGMTFWAVSDLNDAELTTFVRALQTGG